MTDKTWKAFERCVARFFGCHRNPLSGRNSKHTASDSLHEFLFIECKHRKQHAVINLWDKCKPFAKKEGKIHVLALSEKGRPGCWIMVHSSDLTAVANQRLVAKKKGYR